MLMGYVLSVAYHIMESLTMKASDLFIRSLEQEGVEFIFGVPGEENLDFLESLN